MVFHTAIEQTDNSYVKGKTTVLSSQINGYIKDVLVKDFDYVKKGQALIHIDATTYDQKVTQAQSAVEQAKNSLTNQTQTIAQRQADIAAAQAKVDQAQAQYDLSMTQLQRYQQLGDSGAASKSERDKAAADVKNNLALLKQAQQCKCCTGSPKNRASRTNRFRSASHQCTGTTGSGNDHQRL